jgi:2-polyprenyl-3-methyl-5-hydroxy-6-metoxy-1,4-benzoquinol methylase
LPRNSSTVSVFRELLGTVLSTLRAEGFKGPLRVVDVGCGIGYVVRWLAARTALPSQSVELVGVDLRSACPRVEPIFDDCGPAKTADIR